METLAYLVADIAEAGHYIAGMFGFGHKNIVDMGVLQYLRQYAIYYIIALVSCTPIIKMLDEYFRDLKIAAHEEEKKKWNEMNENSLKEDGNASDETNKNTLEQKEDKDKKDNSFLSAINNFTQELSGKEESISTGTKIISMTTGNTYIESNTVLLGKDNWLFYKAKDDGNPILDYQGKNHYSADKMKVD